MSDTYNLYNLEAPFKEYLSAVNHKPVSIKNYLSDIRHFFGWLILYFKSNNVRVESETTITQFITPNVISEYKSYLSENNIPHKTTNRRLSTVRKFCSFCISQGWLKENPGKKIGNVRVVRDIGEINSIRLFEQFSQDLEKQNLNQNIINNYLEDVREFLGLL
ncbi:MAG: site-specific integrase [Candidatus Roizmanbacteria bacterium]|nr:site-specific integrase [Candidatus Roizmanbacteria bacterium]